MSLKYFSSCHFCKSDGFLIDGWDNDLTCGATVSLKNMKERTTTRKHYSFKEFGSQMTSRNISYALNCPDQNQKRHAVSWKLQMREKQ